MTARTRPADSYPGHVPPRPIPAPAPPDAVRHIEPVPSFEEEHPVLATCLYVGGLLVGLVGSYFAGWLP